MNYLLQMNGCRWLHAVLVALFLARTGCGQCETWQPLSSGGQVGVSEGVLALTEYDGDLVAAGAFMTAGGKTVTRIARWDGSSWHALTSGGQIGVNSVVYALTVYNGELIAGGLFTTAGGQSVNHIARWDGSAWHSLTSGGEIGVNTGFVYALTVYNGELIAGGGFDTAGGQTVNRIARWNGSTWNPLASGGQTGIGIGEVHALTVQDSNLVVGGFFATAGGQTVNNIARWDGASWYSLAAGGQTGMGPSGSVVFAVTAYRDELIAGGTFTTAGGIAVNRIARWNGSTWLSLVAGNQTGVSSSVYELRVHSDELVLGGSFLTAGGQTMNRVARWTGISWEPFVAGGSIGVSGQVHSLAVFGGDLIVGGTYANAGAQNVNYIARWRDCSVECFDPNQQLGLIQNGAVTTDAVSLASANRFVEGIVADGVTRVVLRHQVAASGSVEFNLADESGGTADVGTLSTPGGSQGVTTLTVPTTFVNGQNIAFAVLKAPMDFARDASDYDKISRPIHITAEFTPTGGGSPVTTTRQLSLRRPPVLLLHGLWSNSDDAWGSPRHWSLINDSPFRVLRPSYPNADSFAENIEDIRSLILDAVEQVRSEGVATTQVDIVGHSMGGLLARLVASGFTSSGTYNLAKYIRNNNFNSGDIHKLITLDTPHSGSPLATVVLIQSPIIHALLTALGKCTICGALWDLQTLSSVITNLPSAAVRSHAMVGTGGSDMLAQGIVQTNPVLKLLKFLGLYSFAFPTELQHDLIVGRISQEGGLSGTNTSVFGYVNPSTKAIHFGSVTQESPQDEKVIELLNARTSESGLFAPDFPAALGSLPSEAPPRFVTDVPIGLAITSPTPGQVLTAGELHNIVVEPLPGFAPTQVLVIERDSAIAIERPPFVLEVAVPEDALGGMSVAAIGVDADGNLFAAEQVNVNVATTATLTALLLAPQPVNLYGHAPSRNVTVTGIYSDGVERDVTSPSFGTTYATLNPNIATVDVDGKVTSVSIGTTTVTATIGTISASAGVVVVSMPCPADVTGDGMANISDLLNVISAWGPCVPGPLGCPADIAPPPNGDGTVGIGDLLAVVSGWGACQ